MSNCWLSGCRRRPGRTEPRSRSEQATRRSLKGTRTSRWGTARNPAARTNGQRYIDRSLLTVVQRARRIIVTRNQALNIAGKTARLRLARRGRWCRPRRRHDGRRDRRNVGALHDRDWRRRRVETDQRRRNHRRRRNVRHVRRWRRLLRRRRRLLDVDDLQILGRLLDDIVSETGDDRVISPPTTMAVKMIDIVRLPLISFFWAYDINPDISSTRRGRPRPDRAVGRAPCPCIVANVSTYHRHKRASLHPPQRPCNGFCSISGSVSTTYRAATINHLARRRGTTRFRSRPRAPARKHLVLTSESGELGSRGTPQFARRSAWASVS